MKSRASAGLLALAVVVGGCARSPEPGPGAPSRVGAASSTLASPNSTLDAAVSDWRVFTSVAGGYRLRYPPGWRAKESSGSGGPVLSLLPEKGSGISVLVTFTAPNPDAASRPGIRCRPVRIGGLEGSRCQDRISMVVSTTLQGRERWYVLMTSLRRPAIPAGAYDRVLASFRPR